MIQGFALSQDGRLLPVDAPLETADRVIWFDMVNPDAAEETAVERVLGIDVPTREEMEEIEDSSRLYTENGAAFMTALLPSQIDAEVPVMGPVSFILTGGRLVTLRYHEPRAFLTFPPRAEKTSLGCTSGETVLIGLLEAIVDRLADILEKVGRDIEKLSQDVFRRGSAAPGQAGDYRRVLQSVGRIGDYLSNALDSLVSLERLITFLGTIAAQSAKETRARIKTLSRDTRYLSDHASFLSQKINFLLDATLGMISIEQNAIIKIFSVAAVIFLPPTLVASIYGMNFEVMPELGWLLGYPFALGLMVASAVLSFWVFKRQGWL